VIRPTTQAPVSFDRWLGAVVAGEKSGDEEAKNFVREQKAITTTTTGVLIPESFQSQWIDLIRAQSVLNAAGISTVVMDAKTVNYSAVTADPTAAWKSEGSSLSATAPTFAARDLTAELLAVRCQASVECAQDSPDFGQQLSRVMAAAMATELDRVGLVGTGTPPEPHGIVGTSGVATVTASGSPTSYAAILQGVKRLLDNNVPLDVATRFAIMSPHTWFTYESIATGISSDNTQLPRPAALANTRFLVTTNGALDSDNSPQTSTIIMGDFSDLLLGIRRQASVEILKADSYVGNLVLDFVGYLRADYLVRRPSSFVTISGVQVVS
jgi:HK97 family phage major capsid protein